MGAEGHAGAATPNKMAALTGAERQCVCVHVYVRVCVCERTKLISLVTKG